MKKSIKQKAKTDKSSTAKKNTRPYTTQQKGYNEEVYNNEEQKAYDKNDELSDNSQNTTGAKS